MIDDDDTERRQAEALARALEDGVAGDGVPADALETAALLRAAGGAGELGDERAEALLAGLLAGAPEPPRARRGRGVVRVLPVVAALAAAAAVLVVLLVQPDHQPPVTATAPPGERAAAPAAASLGAPSRPLPPASARLLELQAALARGDADARVPFEREMRGYRDELLRTLQGAYPPRLGSYVPRPAVAADGSAP